MNPTDEQRAVLDLFHNSTTDLVVEAGAGTGKTTTLRMLAESTGRAGQYLAFNRAIVDEAKRKMPRNVAVSTVHSLAARNTPREFMNRLRSGRRQHSHEIAKLLGIRGINITGTALGGTRYLAAGYLAGLAMQGVKRFCSSGDSEITVMHLPRITGLDKPDEWTNNRAVAEELLDPMRSIWADWNNPDGRIRYDHSAYLKRWQLTNPQLPADFVLFDEAQDAAPVLRAIVECQQSARRIWVGDSQQQIYGFTGAINALAAVDGERAFLTRSFRFGPQIAEVANNALARLEADLRLIGAGPAGTVGPVDRPDVVLCRTNAGVLRLAVLELANGSVSGKGTAGRPYILGGTGEIVAFVEAAGRLQNGERARHPELDCFESWSEVREYVELDPNGEELALWVDLIDQWGVDILLGALVDAGTERGATVVLATAHKAKGCEWSRVRLADDYPERDNPEDLRLLYVAATRAQTALDPGRNKSLTPAAAAASL